MAKQLQLRQGTTTEHNTFTGAVGELTYDTQKKQLRVHDGSTVGGKVLADTSTLASCGDVKVKVLASSTVVTVTVSVAR